MRDYDAMRDVISTIASKGERAAFLDFSHVKPNSLVIPELQRLIADGLVSGDVREDRSGMLLEFSISGLTDEGRVFLRLIENDDVWRIVRETLREANIDVSYPLLKEVCEEIVKRYVISFVPKSL